MSKKKKKKKKKKKPKATPDGNIVPVPADPIFSPGTGDALEKFIKKLVRYSIKRRSGCNIKIMYGIIWDLIKWRQETVYFGVTYATEERGITMTFSDLAVYISEIQLEHCKSTHIVSTIMHAMITAVNPDWLPESLFGAIDELIGTEKIKSYQSVTSLIMYIMDCDLDEPSPKMVDEMIKSTQCRMFHDATLRQYIINNCNLFEEGGYLDYLENEKSAGLTQWFQPPAGHRQGDRIEHFDLQGAQWSTRIVIISQHTSCVKVWGRCFRMLSTLATNNEKFRISMTFKICIRQLMINYANKFLDYLHLYLFLDAIPKNVIKHLKLSDDIENYDMFIFDPRKYRSVHKELNKCHKRMVYFNLCVLARSIKCDKKYITLRVLHFMYGDEFCRKIQKHGL